MAVKTKKRAQKKPEEEKWPYGKKNYVLFAISLLVIIIGYITLAGGSITLAPILLVVGYCVLIPIALMIKGKPEEEQLSSDSIK
ncbi:MAG: DUF3098 domain-containing protein [FCB group bacterium]|nr:DUF3098 domain-containing protein [FCB group bacterium]